MTARNEAMKRQDGFRSRRKALPDDGPYRRLALQLNADFPLEGDKPRSLLIAPPVGSPLAAHIALTLAQCIADELQSSVLLIDADINQGILSGLLECDTSPGFSEAMLGAGIALEELVCETSDPHVAFLPAGNVGRTGGRQRPNVQTLESVLGAAVAKYDFVALVGGSILNDSLPLAIAPHVGCVLMTPVEHETLAEDLDVAQRSLKLCKARKVGLLLVTAILE